MKFLLLVLFSCCAHSIFTQIKGQLKDDANTPIPFASLAALNANDSSLVKIAITDTAGKFSISVPNGVYIIKASAIGHEDTFSEKTIISETKSSAIINLIISTSTIQLEETTITYTKPPIENTARGLTVNVASSPIMQAGSTRDLLDKIPGVIISMNGEVSLKGKTNVAIYIDGKRSYMSLENLMTWLESLPATELEKVEVFDVAPAKFDAEGAGGVINVVLKKGAALGLNGMVGLNLGHGEDYKVVPWANFNWRQRKFNLYGSGWYNRNKTFEIYDNNYIVPSPPIATNYYDNYAKPKHLYYGMGTRTGMDYNLSKKSTIGVLFMWYDGGWNMDRLTTTDITGTSPLPYDQLLAMNDQKMTWKGQTYNINFVHDFDDKTSLSSDFDLVNQFNDVDLQLSNNFYLRGQPADTNLVESYASTENQILVGKIDFEHEFANGVAFESGLKISSVNTKNDIVQYTGNNQRVLTYDSTLSNNFNYKEDVYGAYATAVKKHKSWIFDLGLRAEYTASKGKSVTLDSTTINNYFNLFPNISVKKTVNKNLDISFAYSRRLSRPNYWQINPFRVQNTEFDYWSGNPNLTPQFTNNYNLNFTIQKAVFLSAGYTHTTDAMSQVILQDNDSQIIVTTALNLDDIHNINFSAIVPVPITKWWILNFDGNVFYNKQISPIPEGNINLDQWTYKLSARNEFSLPKKYKMEVYGYYNSSMYWNTYFVNPFYQIDLGFSKTFGRFSAKLSFQDLFNIRESTGQVRQGDVNYNYYYAYESQKVQLNLSYRFGNDKVKGERKRKTGSEDLKERSGQ